MTQLKNQFDAITIQKILKGALRAATIAGIIFILTYLKTINLGNAILNAAMYEIVASLINAIHEYKKGE